MGQLDVGQIERKTQDRIVALFRGRLKYEYLGNWEDRLDNSNIEEGEVIKYLTSRGYNATLIARALDKLRATANNYSESLYTNNKNVYSLLRYGIGIVENAGENNQQVQLIDWKNPEKNNFAVTEEVTIQSNREKRPDIVLYVNGIAIGVLELKRSTVSVGDGIRQSIVNQQKEFIQSFFSTIQFVFAGNDTEGLKYGTILTPEKYYLKWKEDEQDNTMLQLDKYLLKMCEKKRLLEILYDFVLFDGGIKKLPRPHQYFGIKAAQEYVLKQEGGIIWHTQGSGKSLIMVWLAKWILENNPNARVVVLTDRIELDKQIQRVFHDAGETEMKRTTSGRDLMEQLNNHLPRLLCSLIHKFGAPEIFNTDQGCQFTSQDFTGLLKTYGTQISMDSKGRAIDNVIIERFFRSLKYENIYLREYRGIPELREGVFNYMNFYNYKRPHSSLANLTPVEVYEANKEVRETKQQNRKLVLQNAV